MKYRYFVPDRNGTSGKVPLVLFLHGWGDSGKDNLRQLKHAEPLVFVQPENQKKYPCFFVAPQLPKRQGWTSATWKPLPCLEAAVQIVKDLCARYPAVDTNRLYITGLSAGGGGAFDALAKYPGFFAAAAPISATWDPGMFREAQRVSVWAFYTKTEKALVRRGCDRLLAHIRKNGGITRKTVYPRGGHNAWRWAYKEPELIPWLFQQRRDTDRLCQGDTAQDAAKPTLVNN